MSKTLFKPGKRKDVLGALWRNPGDVVIIHYNTQSALPSGYTGCNPLQVRNMGAHYAHVGDSRGSAHGVFQRDRINVPPKVI